MFTVMFSETLNICIFETLQNMKNLYRYTKHLLIHIQLGNTNRLQQLGKYAIESIW